MTDHEEKSRFGSGRAIASAKSGRLRRAFPDQSESLPGFAGRGSACLRGQNGSAPPAWTPNPRSFSRCRLPIAEEYVDLFALSFISVSPEGELQSCGFEVLKAGIGHEAAARGRETTVGPREPTAQGTSN